jgi:hypothetical protein
VVVRAARYGLAQAVSTDAGKTWREEDTPFTKSFNVNTRFFLRKLASGNLLLVANDTPKGRANMTAMLSADDGRTWPWKLVLDERESVSYPDGTQAPDGSIYLIYDRGRYLFDAQEILMAKFTEADIKAGTILGDTSRFKQQVSKLKDEGGGVRFSGETQEILAEWERIKAVGTKEAATRREESERAEPGRTKK